MRDARRRGAATTSLQRQLGLTLSETGATAEALAVLAPLAENGEPALAQRARSRPVRSGPAAGGPSGGRIVCWQSMRDNAGAYERLGLIELRLGRWGAARDESRRALELNPELPLAWNNLGVALYQLDDAGRVPSTPGSGRWISIPELYDALYNLGTRGGSARPF